MTSKEFMKPADGEGRLVIEYDIIFGENVLRREGSFANKFFVVDVKEFGVNFSVSSAG